MEFCSLSQRLMLKGKGVIETEVLLMINRKSVRSGEAKLADDATRLLPSSAARMAITGPRPDEKVKPSEIDDDIPF